MRPQPGVDFFHSPLVIFDSGYKFEYVVDWSDNP